MGPACIERGGSVISRCAVMEGRGVGLRNVSDELERRYQLCGFGFLYWYHQVSLGFLYPA